MGEIDWSLGRPSWLEIIGQRTKEVRATHSQRKNDFSTEESTHNFGRELICAWVRGNYPRLREKPPEMSRHNNFWNSKPGNTRIERSRNRA